MGKSKQFQQNFKNDFLKAKPKHKGLFFFLYLIPNECCRQSFSSLNKRIYTEKKKKPKTKNPKQIT